MSTMTRIALLGGVLIGASCAVSAETSDAVALSVEQMDSVTAGQVGTPIAAASALAAAQGQFTLTGTRAYSSVTAVQPSGQPPSQVLYVTVNSASVNAAAQGADSQTSASVAGANEQPLPDDSVFGTTIQSSQTVLGATIAFQTQVKMGGNPIYFLLNPRALFGGY